MGFLGLIIDVPAVASYTGPGDVVASASAWWGLRAYSNASIGGLAIRLRRDSDNVEQDFTTIAGGGLDLSGISSFKGAANLFITKLYDQTGNGWTLAQATAANQPKLILASFGVLPAASYTTASHQWLTNTSGLTIPQTFTSSYVAEAITPVDAAIFGKPSGPVCIANYNNANPNIVNVYAGGTGVDTTTAGTDGVFHAVQVVWNSNTSTSMVDGVTTNITSNIGTNGIITEISMGEDNSVDGSRSFNGFIQELGFWSSGFTGTQLTNMNSNQHTYWSF